MMIRTRDPVLLRRQLQQWTNQAMPDLAPVSVLNLAIPGGGRSSETYLLDLSLEGGRRSVRWVLRIEPRNHQIYEDASVERQFRTAREVAARTALPVPRPILFEPDEAWIGAPFFVMERADGRAPPDAYHSEGVLFETPPAEREQLWHAGIALLAELHALDPAPFAFLTYPPEARSDGITQELARWDSFRIWAGVPPDPVLDRARLWLDDHRPAATSTGVAWGDARLSNLLCDRGRCVAMLDWETASLGGAETDLGWWIFYDRAISEEGGIPRLDGIGDGPATIAAWERLSGRKAQAMDWHVAFAGYRFALIVERARALAGARTDTTNFATRMLDKLVRQ